MTYMAVIDRVWSTTYAPWSCACQSLHTAMTSQAFTTSCAQLLRRTERQCMWAQVLLELPIGLHYSNECAQSVC